jgi:maltose-binding protein MalE
VKNKIISAVIMCVVGFLLIAIAANEDKASNKENATKAEGEIAATKEDKVTIWYSYSEYEEYIKSAIESYKKEKNSDFSYELKFISNPGFFDYINKKTLENEGPDLFVLGSEYLEKAYLLGLLDENRYEVFNDSVYGKAAITSSSYNDKIYGYPLGFDVAMLASNKKYVTEEINTFEDIKSYADNFNDISDDISSGESTTAVEINNINGILAWDVNSLLFNYGFAGANISFYEKGNKKININNADTKEAISKYLLLKDYFSLSGEDDYNKIKKDFLEGKIVFSIVGTDVLKDKTEVEYKLQKLPDLTASIKSNSLSYTDLLAVNPHSKNILLARDLAKYISYDYSENMYDIVDLISCRKDIKYENENINECLNIYDQSLTMPNLLETEDFCIVMEESLKSIWNGKDIETALNELQKKYSERIK